MKPVFFKINYRRALLSIFTLKNRINHEKVKAHLIPKSIVAGNYSLPVKTQNRLDKLFEIGKKP